MKKTFYKNLCLKDLANNISDNEKKQLVEWLNRSDSNKLEYESIKNDWDAVAPNRLDLELEIDEEWSKLQSKITSASEIRSRKSNSILDFISSLFAPKLRPAWAIGVSLILLISSVTFFQKSESAKRILKTISTVNNERLEVVLSDGSIVQLNSDSEIQFYENFEENKREVKLKGEVFFSVNKDGRPFIISTDNATTTVLGTKFNVWAREDETRVLVKEGKVSLADNKEIVNKVILTKDELGKVIKALPPSEPSKVNAEYMLGWLDGKLVFDNTPLSEIVSELERYYDAQIVLQNVDFSDYNLTGSFYQENIENVLTKICLALDLKYDNNNEIYKIIR